MKELRILVWHEITGLLRTWRAPVLLGVSLALAVTGPVLARYMGELLSALGGLDIVMMEPTWHDAQSQWAKDLTQIVILLCVLTVAGTVGARLRNGGVTYLLARPVPRRTVLVAPIIAYILIAVTTIAIGMLVQAVATLLVFDGAPFAIPLAISARWVLLITLLSSVTMLGCALTGGIGGGAGVGLGLYFALALLSAFEPLAHYSPAGLITLQGEHWVWPTVTGLCFTVIFGVLAVTAFDRKELTRSQ